MFKQVLVCTALVTMLMVSPPITGVGAVGTAALAYNQDALAASMGYDESRMTNLITRETMSNVTETAEAAAIGGESAPVGEPVYIGDLSGMAGEGSLSTEEAFGAESEGYAGGGSQVYITVGAEEPNSMTD